VELLHEDDGSGLFVSSDFMSGALSSKEFVLDEADEKKDEPKSTEPEVALEPTPAFREQFDGAPPSFWGNRQCFAILPSQAVILSLWETRWHAG